MERQDLTTVEIHIVATSVDDDFLAQERIGQVDDALAHRLFDAHARTTAHSPGGSRELRDRATPTQSIRVSLAHDTHSFGAFTAALVLFHGVGDAGCRHESSKYTDDWSHTGGPVGSKKRAAGDGGG